LLIESETAVVIREAVEEVKKLVREYEGQGSGIT
jgi:hypothetical protein